MNIQGLFALENKVLGKGSFGTVYLGTDIANDRYVSLKKIPGEIMKDPQKIEALSNEILISSGVDNENLVKIIDLTDINNDKYIVYEFCNGGDLRRYLRFFKTFDETAVQYFMKQVLNGLSELHSKKIIHHDIKPANILLHYDNNEDLKQLNLMKCKFKISDFGLSKFKNEQHERMIGGSPLYMEPYLFDKNVPIEIIENEKVDIWSLGILTYELLFGITPFENASFIPDNALRELVSNLSRGTYFINMSYRDKISLQIIAFLNKCLQIEQNKRASSEELLFSEFVTRDIEKFFFLNKYNLKKNIFSFFYYIIFLYL